jgi:hypothetical protein
VEAWALDTKETHLSNLAALRRYCGGVSIRDIIAFCRLCKVYKVLEHEMYTKDWSPNTVKNWVDALKSVLKHIVPEQFKIQWAAEIQGWHDLFNLAKKLAEKPAKEGKATKRQIEGYVPWSRVLACRDALPYASKAHLIMCMWTMIPPLRLDHREVRIVRTLEDLGDWQGSFILLKGHASFLHTARPNKVFGDAPYAGGIQAALPQQLVEVIEASLARAPRDFLFTTHSSKNNLFTKDSYGTCVRNAFRKAVGNKKIGVSILRHVYVTAMYEHCHAALEGARGVEAQAQARDEVAKSAHLMAHSLSMHKLYRFDVSEEGELVPMEGTQVTAHDIPLISAAVRNAPLSVRCF